MAERWTPQEQVKTPEKSTEELYVDALKLKRDVLSSHYAMNSLRRSINERIDQISDEKFSEDEEVRKYEAVKQEYDRRRDIFLNFLGQLSEDDNRKVSELNSLTTVEVALSTLLQEEAGETISKSEKDVTLEEAQRMLELSKDTKRALEAAYWESKVAELQERQKAEADAKRREEIQNRIKEIDDSLAEKYRVVHQVVHQEVNVIDRRPLEEEIKKLEEEKTRLEKEPESPEGKVGKSWGDRIRSVFGRRTAEVKLPPSAASEPSVEPAAPAAPETAPSEIPEATGSKQWTVLGWLAERGKGILSAGIWEVRQAWRFQRGTKFTSNDLEALSTLIHLENADEAQEKANEMLKIMKENSITTVTAPEFLDIAKKVTYEKAAENNDRIEYMIKNAVNTLKEQVTKYRGQATAETVLTPENLRAVENELRMQLNQFRDGATMKDVKSFARVMRDNMDKRWWLRYVYAPLEASLLGYLGYHYLPWSRWFGGEDLIPGGEEVVLSPEEAGQRYMDHNLWEESQEQLKELGVDNPTNEEIQTVDSAAAQENNIRVVNPETSQTLWPETAGGQTQDISMMKGLIKWGAAHKAALAIKTARIAAGLL